MKRSVLFGMYVLFCVTGMSEAQMEFPANGFGEITFHRASIQGMMQWTGSDISGSEIDIDGAFGLDKTNGFGIKAGTSLSGPHELLVDYRRYEVSEETTLETTIRFEDIELPSLLPIAPSLMFQAVGAFYGYRVFDSDSGFLSIRPGLEFVGYEVGVEVDLPLAELESLSYSKDHMLPFVWLAGEKSLHPMASLIGELSGGWKQDQMAYWGRAMLKFLLHPKVSALLGYSHLWFRDDRSTHVFEVTLSGFTLGLQATW